MRTVRPRISATVLCRRLAQPNDWARAGRYHGAMLALAEPMNYHLEPADAIFVTAMLDEAVRALGHDAFAQDRGSAALSVEHAIADVRAWLRAHGSGAGFSPMTSSGQAHEVLSTAHGMFKRIVRTGCARKRLGA